MAHVDNKNKKLRKNVVDVAIVTLASVGWVAENVAVTIALASEYGPRSSSARENIDEVLDDWAGDYEAVNARVNASAIEKDGAAHVVEVEQLRAQQKQARQSNKQCKVKWKS